MPPSLNLAVAEALGAAKRASQVIIALRLWQRVCCLPVLWYSCQDTFDSTYIVCHLMLAGPSYAAIGLLKETMQAATGRKPGDSCKVCHPQQMPKTALKGPTMVGYKATEGPPHHVIRNSTVCVAVMHTQNMRAVHSVHMVSVFPRCLQAALEHDGANSSSRALSGELSSNFRSFSIKSDLQVSATV